MNKKPAEKLISKQNVPLYITVQNFDNAILYAINSILETQAKISFKAGYLEGHNRGWNDAMKAQEAHDD